MINFNTLPSSKHWGKIGHSSQHGIVISLASLKTQTSGGVGEFTDLIPLIDWCQEVGFKIIQLLPINDSGEDPSPYNGLSSCALHPIYLSLSHLSGSNSPIQSLFNDQPRVAYQEVLKEKYQFLRKHYKDHRDTLLKDPFLKKFEENHPWVKPYSLFKALKEQQSSKSWINWPKEYQSVYFHELFQKNSDEVWFYIVLQYMCYQQLSHVKKYAHDKGIRIMGDIPILVSRNSADTWYQPHLFNFQYTAGAPPDIYNLEGQNWGFPLYQWDVIKQDNYQWWKQRLQAIASYYDLYRIDHAVGFFRIWAIPLQLGAREGQFIPIDERLWVGQGKEILQMMLKTSSLLPIAEDLGNAPLEVENTLLKLGICQTKMMRGEKDLSFKEKWLLPKEYPLLSITTVSTHDSEPLQLWWKTALKEVQSFCDFKGWKYTPSLPFEYHVSLLKESHRTRSIFHINLLQEYLALFPELVFSDPEEERINRPGLVLPKNWTYRLKVPMEKICQHEPLKKIIKEILPQIQP